MSKILPTLTSTGYISDPTQMLDRLLAYFLESNASQSSLYPEKTPSLAYILAINADNVTNIPTDIDRVLTKYLSDCFKSVTVQSTVTPKDNNDVVYHLSIEIEAITDTDEMVRMSTIRDIDTALGRVVDELLYGDSF